MSASSSAGSSRLMYTVGIGVGVSVLSGISYLLHRYLKRDVMPIKWRRVGTLEQINLFPIKSCAPLKLSPETEVLCEVLSLRLDGIRERAMMLVNDKNKMITARVYPKMVLITIKKIGESTLLISAPHMTDLELDCATLAEEGPGVKIRTSVWGAKIDVMLCGEKYDKWFSKCILDNESGLRLVYYPYPKPVRATNPRMLKEPYISQSDSGTFNDATSYMLMNLASVDDLNTRIPNGTVDALQFRGNFHLKMDKAEPYAEDKWQWIKIGDEAIFRIVAPCTRCIFPNINPYSGERNPNGEPLKTLKRYRQWPNYTNPSMGIHLGVRQPGTIKSNDVIYVEDN